MKNSLENLRHSAAHLLAAAVMELWPNTKRTIGPAIEEGFYFDFEFKNPITEDSLKRIEKKMRQIIKTWDKFTEHKLSSTEAKKEYPNNKYKHELIDEFSEKGKKKLTFYKSGEYWDLCKGNHVKNPSKELQYFKLLSVAGAYWKGDSNNTMLTRIYGTIFPTEKELKEFLIQREEAEKRNHITLGKQLGIFTISNLVGKGLPLWLPKGNIIKEEIEKLAKEKEEKAGYVRVTTPHLAKKELFLKSGHLPYYEEDMYPAMKMDDGTYYLKAMNCPMHHIIFKNNLRSYRDLPLRIAEYGDCYRNELSGALTGLLRVRRMIMNDAHIYCTKNQIEKEFSEVIKLTQDYFKIFDLKNYWFRLSKWDPKNKKKYINEPKNWEYCEETLRKLLKKLKVKFIEVEDEAAFYGPKVDVQFKSVFGREETMSTIQLDFAAKERFNLAYQDSSGEMNKEVFVIHRAPLSTHERFVAFLIEHYVGKFPIWLAPIQIKILALTDRNNKYVENLEKELKKYSFRIETNTRSESMSKKVRDAQKEHIPIILTVGDKEQKSKTLALRTSDGKVKFGVNTKSFIEKVKKSIDERKDAKF